MKIAIMGGTFNPIHQGHLILSEFIREDFYLDKIIFVPTGISPHKFGHDILDKSLRKEMLNLAIESNNNFTLSTIEMEREGKSFTIDTINELRLLYPKDDLYMIIGADSLLELHGWKDHDKIISSINLIVADRYNAKDGELVQRIQELNKKYRGNIKRISTPIIDISSTEIRYRLGTGLSIKYLVPESVERYIIDNKLYI